MDKLIARVEELDLSPENIKAVLKEVWADIKGTEPPEIVIKVINDAFQLGRDVRDFGERGYDYLRNINRYGWYYIPETD